MHTEDSSILMALHPLFPTLTFVAMEHVVHSAMVVAYAVQPIAMSYVIAWFRDEMKTSVARTLTGVHN